MVDVIGITDQVKSFSVLGEPAQGTDFDLRQVSDNQFVSVFGFNHVAEIHTKHFVPRKVLEVEVTATATKAGCRVCSTVH